MTNLVDVRCPMPSKRNAKESCNKLCVRVTPGSSGTAYCSRHDSSFDFQVDDHHSFDVIIPTEKPFESGPTADIEHPITSK